jgi:GTP-binding protein
MFVDRVKVEITAGNGGSGCSSFRRERYVPRGGPDGGDGGIGGSVIIVAKAGVNHLSALAHRKFWKAADGKRGQGSQRRGRNGDDIIIEVPPGTVVIDAHDELVMKDLDTENDRVVAARGGRGGKGNTHFKSSTNRAPRHKTPGEEGEHRVVIFELKVIADVGLVGKPNAGKSTLLSRLTKAKPEIADYPFTTKHPNLGQVQVDLDRRFVIADIPGLIEGAHAGVGLGHEFLRHIERAGILVHLVEPLPMDETDPVHNYQSIREELKLYNDELARRPEILCVSKSELAEAADVRRQLVELTGSEVLLISAVTGQGLNELIRGVAAELDRQKNNRTKLSSDAGLGTR